MQVLIATLGESPIVVISAISHLHKKRKIDLDKVCLLYTESPGVEQAFEIIDYYFNEIYTGQRVEVEGISLGIPDLNSEKNCMIFLQVANEVFKRHINHRIHLLLAGGRKSMSALLGFIGLFYPNIDGMYHILDRNEDNPQKRNFHSIEDLVECLYDKEQLKRWLSPPLDELNLFDIPYDWLAPQEELPRLLATEPKDADILGEVLIREVEDDFFRILCSRQNPVEIKISKKARSTFLKLDRAYQKVALDLIKLLFDESFREKGEGRHASFRGANKGEAFYVAKRSGAFPLRIFWYQLEGTVVICEITTHEGKRSDYDEKSRDFNNKKGTYAMYPPVSSLEDLESGKGVVVAGVGKSPLVISQAYRGLCKGTRTIEDIYLLHTSNNKVKRGVEILKEVFSESGVTVHSVTLPDTDIDSTERCRSFTTELVELIDRVRTEHPQEKIYLLLSGGRKGMSVLSLFAANLAKLPNIYLTLITDPHLEKILLSKEQVDHLNRLYNKEDKIKYLMLEQYGEDQFHLLKLPAVPFKTRQTQ